MKNVLKSGIKFLAVFVTLLTMNAYAGGANGGGNGGVYVCSTDYTYKESTVDSVELVDLFEVREVNGLKIVYDDQTPVETQVQNAIHRLMDISPTLGRQTQKAWNYINTPGNIVWAYLNELSMAPPNDVDSNLIKHSNGKDCPLAGMMYFSDVSKRLVILSYLFNFQKKTERAASYLHEAVYKAMRDNWGAQDSVMARHITGCLFSEDYVKCLNLRPVVIPHGAVKCTSPDMSFYVAETKPNPQGGLSQNEWKLVVLSYKGDSYKFETSTKSFSIEVSTGGIKPYQFLKVELGTVSIKGLKQLVNVLEGGSIGLTKVVALDPDHPSSGGYEDGTNARVDCELQP